RRTGRPQLWNFLGLEHGVVDVPFARARLGLVGHGEVQERICGHRCVQTVKPRLPQLGREIDRPSGQRWEFDADSLANEFADELSRVTVVTARTLERTNYLEASAGTHFG